LVLPWGWGWRRLETWWSRPAPSVEAPRPVKVARSVVAPGSFIGTGIVSHPLLMEFGVIRNSLSIYKWFSSVVLIFYIQVRVRKNPTDLRQLFEFEGEFLGY
jgi:hypothetical protein